ncbi:MAG: hypothetical protein ABL998_15705 [Planctomycetota bacterium]
MSRRSTRALLALGVLVLGAGVAWCWPLGRAGYRLGGFEFEGPRGLVHEGTDAVLGEHFHVSLCAEEPYWSAPPEEIQLAGHEVLRQEVSCFAPVVGGDPRAGVVRDHTCLLWFHEPACGVSITWRTFGGAYWPGDLRRERFAALVERSLAVTPGP